MNGNIITIGSLLILATFIGCLSDSDKTSEGNNELKYTGDTYRLLLGRLGVARLKAIKSKNILTANKLKETSTTKFQDTIITFEPTYLYEKATFLNGSKSPNTVKVISDKMRRLSKTSMGPDILRLVNNNKKKDKFFLTRISVELRSANTIEKKSINLHPIMESQHIEVANEIINKEFAWLFEGSENFSSMVLSDLEFRSVNEFVKIEHPVLVGL